MPLIITTTIMMMLLHHCLGFLTVSSLAFTITIYHYHNSVTIQNVSNLINQFFDKRGTSLNSRIVHIANIAKLLTVATARYLTSGTTEPPSPKFRRC